VKNSRQPNGTPSWFGQYLEKGRQVYVEGMFRHRSYENKEGKEQRVTEIVAQKVRFLSGPSNGKSSEVDSAPSEPEDDIPF
jgi:single-strand DNA-binding protein